MQENIFDVLAIQETKIDDSFPDSQFTIPRFKLYRQDYKCNQGGIIMYIRNDMPQFRRLDLEQLSINNANGRIEILAVEVTLNKEKWLFISIYKQPKVKIRFFTECVDNIMMKCINYDVNIVMLGDFNVNMLKSNDFTDCLDVNGLKNIVKDTTCVKGTPTIIDLIVTNEPKRFKRSVCVDTGLSDFHSLVCTATKLQIPKLIQFFISRYITQHTYYYIIKI